LSFPIRRRMLLALSPLALGVVVAACTRASVAPAAAQGTPVVLSAGKVPDPGIAPAKSRLGINLNGPADWNSEIPFVDVFRLSREWISQKQGAGWGKGPKLELDERGWVKRLEPDCWAETPLLTLKPNTYPAGEYVCLYDGEGKIAFNNIKRVVSSEKGRIVFEPAPERGGFFLQLHETNPANPIRNIRVLLPGTEKTYKKEPYNPVFLVRWKGMNTLRFMDWQETNGSKLREWAERPKPDDATWTRHGIPVEVMVDLCNRLKVNPWFCMPHRATDDYVRQFAKQVKTTLDPALTVYIEYSNEIWNGQFEQTRYSEREGQKRGYAEKPWEAGWKFSGVRSAEMFKIWEEAFGGRERLVRVVAGQAANPYIAEQKIKFQDVYKSCDAIAIAPYVSMNLGPNSNPSAETVAGWSVEQVLDHLETKALPESVEWIQKHKELADRYKLRLIGYEGGQHAVGVGGGENNAALTKLLLAANRHERMGKIYDAYLTAWKDAGGDLMCLFSSVGEWSKWGSWGLLEHNGDDTPKYRATVKWMAANPK
jgi:hypothetical protein